MYSHIPLSHAHSQTPQSIQLDKGLGCKNTFQNNCIYKFLLEKKHENVDFPHAVSFFRCHSMPGHNLAVYVRKHMHDLMVKRPDLS